MSFAAEQLIAPSTSAGKFRVKNVTCTDIRVLRLDTFDRVVVAYRNHQIQASQCIPWGAPKLKADPSNVCSQKKKVLEQRSTSCTGASFHQQRVKLYGQSSLGSRLATKSTQSTATTIIPTLSCPLRRLKRGLNLPLTDLHGRIAGNKFTVHSSNPDITSGDPPSKDTESTAQHSLATRDLETSELTLGSRMGQSINVRGIGVFFKLVFGGDSHLAVPHISVPDIRWIDWRALKAAGFHGVVFDKDNTLTVPYAQVISPDLLQPLQDCRRAFDGQIAILSNSAGLWQFDPQGLKAAALEKQLQIPVIRHGQKKPGGNAEDLATHFGLESRVQVGDRYLTDVIYGNRNGLLTVRCAPLAPEKDPLVVRQVRMLEDMMVLRWQARKVQPTPHPVAPVPLRFLKDPGCW